MGGAAASAGSLVLEATLREGIWTTIELRDDPLVRVFGPGAGRAEFSLEDLGEAPQLRDPAGAAIFLLKQWYPDRVERGADIWIKSEFPPASSVGCSASTAVAVMKTAARAYGVDLDGVALATACQWVENALEGAACGGAEQASAAMGEAGCVLPVLCQPCIPAAAVTLPEELRLWGVAWSPDGEHGPEQEQARAAAFMAYKLICDREGVEPRLEEGDRIPRWTDDRWNGYLSNVPLSLFRSNYESRLPKTMTGAEYLRKAKIHLDPFTAVKPELSYRLRACARFAVEENLRARLSLELLRAGAGFEEVGELMYQSHYGYIECGLGCEAADYLVSLVCEEGRASGLYGAKITGRGAGGVVAVLGRAGAEEALGCVIERWAQLGKLAPYLFAGSSMGADRFGVMAVEK